MPFGANPARLSMRTTFLAAQGPARGLPRPVLATRLRSACRLLVPRRHPVALVASRIGLPDRFGLNDRGFLRVHVDEGRAMNDNEAAGGRRPPKGRIAALLVLMIATIVVYAIVLLRLE